MSVDLSSTSSQNPNDRQVGGSHYQTDDSTGICPHCGGTIQHWDLFARMPYIVVQVTRYVLRFRGKNGKEDLEKARHYLDKVIEVYFGKKDPNDKKDQDGAAYDQAMVNAVTSLAPSEPSDAQKSAEALQRADAYARQRPDNDVPAGWVLETAAAPGMWHYRRTNGSIWSAVFASREAALAELKTRA